MYNVMTMPPPFHWTVEPNEDDGDGFHTVLTMALEPTGTTSDKGLPKDNQNSFQVEKGLCLIINLLIINFLTCLLLTYLCVYLYISSNNRKI